MATVIQPTVGRVVWFRKEIPKEGSQPFAALVAKVISDRLVNLTVMNEDGTTFAATSVTLVQEGESPPSWGCYCEWMPYQKGQAAKYEALTAVADSARKGFGS